jgi:hypothetical protein
MSDDDPATRTILGDCCRACGAVVGAAELLRIGYLPQGRVFTQTPCPHCGHVQDFAVSHSLEEISREATAQPRCDRCGGPAGERHARQVMTRDETSEGE